MKITSCAVLLTAAFALSACSSVTPQPSADAPTGSAFPPRPYAIDIESRDPCRTLTRAQVEQRQFVTAKRFDFGPSLPGCTYRELGTDSYLVQFLKYTPAARLLPGVPGQEGTRDTKDPTPSRLDGFGTVESRLTRGSPADCVVTVDTADSSSIQFIFSTLDTRADTPADLQTGCDKARRFASLGLQNLAPR